MHITIKDPSTGEIVGILCVERPINSCIILSCDVDHLSEIISIARAMKVDSIRMTVPESIVSELKESGWRIAEKLVVLVKNGK